MQPNMDNVSMMSINTVKTHGRVILKMIVPQGKTNHIQIGLKNGFHSPI